MRRQNRAPSSPKEMFLEYLVQEFGFDRKQLESSALLSSGPEARDLDISEMTWDEMDSTEQFRDLEEKFDIELTTTEWLEAKTVVELWKLIERKIKDRDTAETDGGRQA